MLNISELGADIVAATASGLLVLAAQRLLDAQNARQQTAESSTARATARGPGASAIVQDGWGNTAQVDQSHRTTTIHHHNTASPPTTPEDAFITVLFGTLTAAGLIVMGFVWSENSLRFLFAGLWGAALASGMITLTRGRLAGMSTGWQVSAALPWSTACAWSGHVWGRWTGAWGSPLPRLKELTAAVKELPVDASAPRLQQAVDGLKGTVGLLLDPSRPLTPGFISIATILVSAGMLVMAVIAAAQSTAAAHVAAGGRLWPVIARWAGPFLHRPWRAGAGLAAAFIIVAACLWFATSPTFAEALVPQF